MKQNINNHDSNGKFIRKNTFQIETLSSLIISEI